MAVGKAQASIFFLCSYIRTPFQLIYLYTIYLLSIITKPIVSDFTTSLLKLYSVNIVSRKFQNIYQIPIYFRWVMFSYFWLNLDGW